MAGGSRQPGRSVTDKVSAIFSAFEKERRPLSLTEVAERAELPLSSAHRMVGDRIPWR